MARGSRENSWVFLGSVIKEWLGAFASFSALAGDYILPAGWVRYRQRGAKPIGAGLFEGLAGIEFNGARSAGQRYMEFCRFRRLP